MFPVDIPKRSHACFKDKEPFLSGMDYFSALLLDEKKSGFIRHDYCTKCWHEVQNSDTSNKTYLKDIASTWKSSVPKKQVIELPKLRDERALHLLKEAISSEEINTDANLQNEAFILSLFLSRKRKLLFRQEIVKNSLTYTLFEVKETEEMLLVPKLEISELEIEMTRKTLAAKFNAK